MTMTIDCQKIMRGAVQGAPLSLKDDPTAYPDGDLTTVVDRDILATMLTATAKENALSGLARAFGAEAERIGTLMDTAVAEDGPLADLDGIWAAEIQGVRPTLPDLTPVAAAADWEARVEALKAIMATTIETMVASGGLDEAAAGQLDTLISLDPRLAHLADAEVEVPQFLGGGRDPLAHVEESPEDEQFVADEFAPRWDDEPEEEIVWDDEKTIVELPLAHSGTKGGRISSGPPKAPAILREFVVETGRRGRGKRNGKPVPKLCGLLETAGFQDKEIAAILGIDKSTYSLMRSGKRPWQGLRDEQAQKLGIEIGGRVEALNSAFASLSDAAVRLPDGA